MLKKFEVKIKEKRKYNPFERTVEVDAGNTLLAISVVARRFKNAEILDIKEIGEDEENDSSAE